MKEFEFQIDTNSDIPKFQQIINTINDAIGERILNKGECLPSVNSVSKSTGLSRDTIFKAYTELKDQRVINAVQSKGYFVASDVRKVLLVLDTFKSYKEVLYHSFKEKLPSNFIVDVQFHHYNIDNFRTIINNSIGKYYKYVIMSFDDNSIPKVLSKISNDKILMIDWGIQVDDSYNFVFQDFGVSFYKALEKGKHLLKKYHQVHFLYPSYTNHPKETLVYFEKFCRDYNINFEIITKENDFSIQKNVAYISVSDRMLGLILEQCQEMNYEPGRDVGILSYNDSPMKPFIYKGITVISTDFKQLGYKGAEFVTAMEPMRIMIKTDLIIRESL
ncbi:substrate-binding domain-containing protein [Flavobacterium faecale]|uniref:substrate-binding domain-containing protein n=1 Tax=Flavobacterium faecale TaxID=1355330 RepID=UPI003AAD76EB